MNNYSRKLPNGKKWKRPYDCRKKHPAEECEAGGDDFGLEEGVVFADANNVIVEVNESFSRFVDRKREALLGKDHC